MFRLESLADDLEVLRSPLLDSAGVPHAFSTRIVGACGDLAVAERAGLAPRRLVRVRQVHGGLVHLVTRGTRAAGVTDASERSTRAAAAGGGALADASRADASRVDTAGEPPPDADAIVGNHTGDVLAVVTADCVPVLLASADGRVVAAVHAGWRGLLAGLLPAAMAAMDALGGRAALAAIGPCLSPARFEVGPEVGRAFVAAGHAERVVPGRGDRLHVDLAAVASDQLSRGGVTRIDLCGLCTWDARWSAADVAPRPVATVAASAGMETGAAVTAKADAPMFHSHRRDVTHGGAPRTGRQLALIAPRAG